MLALSTQLLHANAMSNTDKDKVAMAAERTLNDNSNMSSISYSVSIDDSNNDINVTVMNTNSSQKTGLFIDTPASEIKNLVLVYITAVKIYSDLGNLYVIYESNKGTKDNVYGLRSWAEQVRKEGNYYNKDDLIKFTNDLIFTSPKLKPYKSKFLSQ